MTGNTNSLVIDRIRSADLDDNTKQALEEIFISEINHGNSEKDKKYKITHFREIIAKRHGK